MIKDVFGVDLKAKLRIGVGYYIRDAYGECIAKVSVVDGDAITKKKLIVELFDDNVEVEVIGNDAKLDE